MRTTTQHLADLLLGVPVERWVADQRSAGRSWRLIARDLEDATDARVIVTDRTLRNWMTSTQIAA
jgi:hypothetical protein